MVYGRRLGGGGDRVVPEARSREERRAADRRLGARRNRKDGIGCNEKQGSASHDIIAGLSQLRIADTDQV